MLTLDSRNYEPASSLVHQLINKLTVIIGGCDLLQQKPELTEECKQRIVMIQQAAQSMVHEIAEYQGHGEAAAQTEPRRGGISAARH